MKDVIDVKKYCLVKPVENHSFSGCICHWLTIRRHFNFQHVLMLSHSSFRHQLLFQPPLRNEEPSLSRTHTARSRMKEGWWLVKKLPSLFWFPFLNPGLSMVHPALSTLVLPNDLSSFSIDCGNDWSKRTGHRMSLNLLYTERSVMSSCYIHRLIK